MTAVVVLSPDELEAIVDRAVRKALRAVMLEYGAPREAKLKPIIPYVPPTDAQLDAEEEQRATSGYVYFVQGEDGGPIKIGVSYSARVRVASLQTGSPVRLKLLGVMRGGMRAEAELHERFAESQLHGEWFKPTRELLELISTLGAAP